MDIPISSPLSYVGVFLAILGFFLILAGSSIIKIEKVTVTTGRKTWIGGIVILILGIIFLLPDIRTQVSSPTPKLTVISETQEVSIETDQPERESDVTPDPYLYDDFEDVDFDGDFDQLKWFSFTEGDAQGEFYQEDGYMVIYREGGTENSVCLDPRTYHSFEIDEPTFFEAQLKLPRPSTDDPQNGYIYFGVFSDIKTEDYASCKLDYAEGGDEFSCHFASKDDTLFDTGPGNFEYEEWYEFRLEVYPSEMEFVFYINDFHVGSYCSENADELRNASFMVSIGLHGWEDEAMIGYLDAVRIGDIE